MTHQSEIKICGRFGLGFHGNRDVVLECIEKLVSVKPKSTVKINMSELDFIYPDGMNILTTLFVNLLFFQKCSIDIIHPQNRHVSEYFTLARCDAFFGSSDIDIEKIFKNSYKLKNFRYVDDYEIDKLLKVIKSELDFSDQVQSDLHEIFAELIMNTRDHSLSEYGCFLNAQTYPTTSRIRFSISDLGIGIKTHLSKKYQDWQDSETSWVIKMALVDGVSGTNFYNNSGAGLHTFENFVTCCGGEFIILSENGFYKKISTYTEHFGRKIEEEKFDLPFFYPGTLVCATIQAKPGVKIFKRDEDIPPEYRLLDL
ncbi:MAG: hypothetical protein AB1454_12915 [Candidatus Auribacterota bacterium]